MAIVDKVRNATTKESAVHYEVTLRVWVKDLEEDGCDARIGDLIRKAVNGISDYPIVQNSRTPARRRRRS